jgi:hypothetical protein
LGFEFVPPVTLVSNVHLHVVSYYLNTPDAAQVAGNAKAL